VDAALADAAEGVKGMERMTTASALGFNRLAIVAASLALLAPADCYAQTPAKSVETLLNRYCARLVTGTSASTLKSDAAKDGFKEELVFGQRVMVKNDVLLGLSDAPRVCFLQAPTGFDFQAGQALVDAWAGSDPDAKRSLATRGPDGSPVRAWVSPGRKQAINVVEQTNASGNKVVAFILMPFPPAAK
jgi:phage gp36-like protein